MDIDQEKRMAGDYEIIHALHIGDREIVLGENPSAPEDERYLDAGVIPRFASCSIGIQWFRERGLWQDRDYEPRPGDLIFFDWDDEDEGQDGAADHVGIVEKVDGGIVYTVEGNSGNACRERQYAIGHAEIYGYGTPAY